MAIALRKPNELTKLKLAGSIVGKTLKYLQENVTVGMTLKEIDAMGKWTVVSEDRLRTSHYEHTVAIINNRAVIISD